MDNNGQVAIFLLMVGTVIILLSIALAPAVKTFADDARNASNMDCTNTSISNFDKATCVTTDLSIFYFIGGLIFLGGAVAAARRFMS